MRLFVPRPTPFLLALGMLAATACAEIDPPTTVEVGTISNLKGPEEEVLGDVYCNGAKLLSSQTMCNGIDVSSLYVTLEKIEPNGSVSYSAGMMVEPDGYDGGWMYGWFDTEAWDGPCAEDPNGVEVHEAMSTDPESHCVEMGSTYRYTLATGGAEPVSGNGPHLSSSPYQVLKQFTFDYPSWNPTQVWYSGQTKFAYMEQAGGGRYMDVYAVVDLVQNTGSDQPVLWIDNAGTALTSGDNSFSNNTSPAGSNYDYFRFSASGSSYTSNIPHTRRDEPMAKLWVYSGTQLIHSTNWYTFRNDADYGYLRTMRFADLCRTSGTYHVALDLMRPDEPVPTAPSGNAAWRTIQVSNSGNPLPSHCPPPPAPMTLSIGGTSSMQPYMTCPVWGSLSGGQAPYTWSWTVTGKGGSVVPTSPGSADVTIRYSNIVVTATVTDGLGGSVQASFPISSSSSAPSVCL